MTPSRFNVSGPRALLLVMLATVAAAPFPTGPSQPGLPFPPEEFTDPPPFSHATECDNALCWTPTDKWAVAHICWDEARGLLTEGLMSCAAVVANRQAHPEVWGSADLGELLRFSQFSVISAKTRPWEQGRPPPPGALAAIDAYLSNLTGPGCRTYDSFQTSTPAQAHTWLAQAPDQRCILVREPQAMLFFNWRDG